MATSSPESTLVCSAGWTCGPALHFMPDVWSKIVLAKETPRGRLLEWGGTETQSGEKGGDRQKQSGENRGRSPTTAVLHKSREKAVGQKLSPQIPV